MPFGDPDPMQRRLNLKDDPYRPAYHYLAPDDWLNDPNGTVYWKGQYHLFYQSAARFPLREPVLAHWSHAVSDDLVHWRDLPPALSPEEGAYDALGCWSGTSLVEEDRVIASYHANRGGACLAFSDEDELVNWRKHPGNPLIPFDPGKTYDPCIFRHGSYYYLISGRITGAKFGDGRDQQYGGKDVAYLYRSKDLDHWEDRGVFYEGGVFTRPGEDCACPDFFPIGGKYMLVFISHNQGAQYYLGRYENERFIPEAHGRMNFTAPGLYELGNSGDVSAAITWKGPGDRRVWIAWMPEGRSPAAQDAAGWAGILTLPRDLSLDGEGRLLMRPIPELETLRGEECVYSDIKLAGDEEIPLDGVGGDCLEIEAVIEPGDVRDVGLKVRCSPDCGEQTIITFDPAEGTLTLDPALSSTNSAVIGRDAQRAPLTLAAGEPLRLRIFIDRSVVEVFANGRQCVAKRIYPAREDSLGVRLFAHGGQALAKSVRVWKMNPVWPV